MSIQDLIEKTKVSFCQDCGVCTGSCPVSRVLPGFSPQQMVGKFDNTLVIDCEENLGFVCTDQTRVKQILFNLLSNSCKFTSNGKITLSAYKENKNNQGWLCFKVKDTGIGIPTDKIESLFQPFVQADISTTRLYGGTGLGLTIIKHFITLMNGVINVNSAVGKGTTFYIKLPINNGQC